MFEERDPILMDENTINPTINDIHLCPNPDCNYDKFYLTDYNRIFCVKCKREIRNSKEFKGGKLLPTSPLETVRGGRKQQ